MCKGGQSVAKLLHYENSEIMQMLHKSCRKPQMLSERCIIFGGIRDSSLGHPSQALLHTRMGITSNYINHKVECGCVTAAHETTSLAGKINFQSKHS